MKTFISILVIIATVVGVRYLVGAVITNEQVRTVNSRANDPSSEPVVSIAEGKKEFMTGCDTGEFNGDSFSQTQYCGCVFDKSVAKHGLNKIVQIGLNASEAEMTSFFSNEVSVCLAEQGA